MKVYYFRDHYADRRNIINIIPNLEYINVTHTPYYVENAHEFPELRASYYGQTVNKTDGLCHFFNYINLGTSDFITTFESWLPRRKNNKYVNKKNVSLLLGHVASEKCKGIIAISECAGKLQEKFLDKNATIEQKELISSKLHILHPPQPIIKSYPSEIDDYINFIFIGHDFFRKGGFEVLSAFDELNYSFSNFRLYIISKLNLNNRFNVSHSLPMEANLTIEAVKNRPYIIWHESLPYVKILQLLSSCHVGLLPSYFDTYGYSVLEMQAAGIPVITTSIRAFPEINSPELGWIINLEQEIGCASSRDIVVEVRNMVRKKLTEMIGDILMDPTSISRRGKLCLDRIKAMHDPALYATNLAKIYGLI